MNKNLSIVIISLFLCLPITAQTVQQKDTLSLLHITDLHLIFDQQTFASSPDFMVNRQKYENTVTTLKSFLKEVPKQTKSNMVIATGDLVDFFEVDIRDEKYREAQIQGFCNLIKASPVPVFCAMGNHDLFSFYWKDGKLTHDQNSTFRSRSYFIKHVPCFENGTIYSKIYQVGKTSYRLIFLDNGLTQYKREKKSEVPYIDKAQLQWLKAQLDESPDDVEIILMHIPFDLLKTDLAAENELYALLTQENSVKLILAGHLHKSFIRVYPSANNKQLTEVQTAALARGRNNWRQIRLTENTILISTQGKTETVLSISTK